MNNNSVLVLILNWNNYLKTLNCIKSILKSNYKQYKIVIVDNNSSDDSVKKIHEEFPGIEIIQNCNNLGYSGGNNVGLRKYLNSDFQFVFIINNDCILDDNCLKELVDAYKSLSYSLKVGFLGSLVFLGKKELSSNIQFSGSYWSESSIYYTFSQSNPKNNEYIKCPIILGCSLFCSFDLLREIGLFDERFFLLWEETDICLRAIKNGYNNFCIPTSKIWHESGSSFQKLNDKKQAFWNYFYRRNQLLWVEKHFLTAERNKYYIKLLLEGLISALRMYLSPRTNARNKIISAARLQAYLDYVTRRFGDCPQWLRNSC